jgi:hypothetical protein
LAFDELLEKFKEQQKKLDEQDEKLKNEINKTRMDNAYKPYDDTIKK